MSGDRNPISPRQGSHSLGLSRERNPLEVALRVRSRLYYGSPLCRAGTLHVVRGTAPAAGPPRTVVGTTPHRAMIVRV
jgi:hypothetical protein